MQKKILRVKYLIPFLVLILMLVGFVGCGNPYKSEEAIEYLEKFEYIKEEFMDKYELAGTTPRIALSSVISEMQDSKRDLSRLDPPENFDRLSGVKELCLYGMDKVIEGFQEFQMENETQSLLLLIEADKILESVDKTINEIKEDLNK